MAQDVIPLGPGPAGEASARVGDSGYAEIAVLRGRRSRQDDDRRWHPVLHDKDVAGRLEKILATELPYSRRVEYTPRCSSLLHRL